MGRFQKDKQEREHQSLLHTVREDVGLQWSDDIESTRALGVAQKIRTVAHCFDHVTHLHFSDIKRVAWQCLLVCVVDIGDLLLLLLCSTQPNSQMASTKGEEDGGGGGGGGETYKPEFRPVHQYTTGKRILKNLREYLLLEKEHSFTLIAHSFEP